MGRTRRIIRGVSMKELEIYLKQAVEHQSSYLFFIAGGFVSEKHDGIISTVESERLMPEDTEKLVRQLYKYWHQK